MRGRAERSGLVGKMPSPRVSVIVPLFNKASTITRALRSIQRQDFPDFEAIIVDDGSTDGGGALVSAFEDDRFELIAQENSGPGAARNRGAARAIGEYLAFLDADDEWHPTYLSKAVSLLEAEPDIAWCVSGYVDCLTGKSSTDLWRRQGLRSGRVEIEAGTRASLVLKLLRFILTPSTTIRRTAFLEVGGFYDRSRALYGEDTFLWLRLLFSGRSLHIELDPHFRFHREDSGLSRNVSGPRPVEPFLLDPDPLLSECPLHLRPLLLDVLRARAHKTACMLGFWGDWRRARSVRKRFPIRGGWRSPLLLPALAAGTPLAPWAGSLWRRIAGVPASRAS